MLTDYNSFISRAIHSLAPGVNFVQSGDQIIEWHSDTVAKPSDAAIRAEALRLQQEWEKLEYQRERQGEYPSIQTQLDMLYHDALEGTTTWQDAVAAVKAKYPKPEGV